LNHESNLTWIELLQILFSSVLIQIRLTINWIMNSIRIIHSSSKFKSFFIKSIHVPKKFRFHVSWMIWIKAFLNQSLTHFCIVFLQKIMFKLTNCKYNTIHFVSLLKHSFLCYLSLRFFNIYWAKGCTMLCNECVH